MENMENIEMIAEELSAEQMTEVAGGAFRMLPEKEGFIVYKIVSSDTLTRIAQRYRCTVNDLLRWNPKITNKNLIYTGDYLYIRA